MFINLIQYRNTILFALLSVLWGTSFVAISVGLEALPPLLFAALRYDIAGVLLLAYAAIAADQWRPHGKDEWLLVSIGGILVIGVHFAFLFIGQTYVTSGIAAIVLSTAPILTPLFAWVLLPDERVGISGAIGILLGLVGVALIASPDPSAVDGTAVGVLLLVLSAASFAFGAVLVKRLPARMELIPSQAWMMLIGAVSLHIGSPLRGEAGISTVVWNIETVISLLYLAIVAGAIGFVIYFDLLEEIGAIEISLVNYIVPVVAAVFGWLMLSESITGQTVSGFAVIFVGFVLLKWDTVSSQIIHIQARLSRGHSVENEYVDISAIQSENQTQRRSYPADD